MKNVNSIRLFLVDDDSVYLKTLELEFMQSPGFDIKLFKTGEECLSGLTGDPDIIILDYHLNGIKKDAINGLETLDKIKELNANIPVIMLSSQDKIDVAINCMHHRAYDYVVKSETAFLRLKNIIASIFIHKKMEKELSWYMERM